MAQLKSTSIAGTLSVSGPIVGNNFKMAGGASDQVLMANGDTKQLVCSHIVSVNASGGPRVNTIPVFNDTGGTTLWYTDARIESGNLTISGDITGDCFNANSDVRLKENIEEYKAEKSILDLPIYKYDYINGSKKQIGCLAQDLQEICPEIVHEKEDGYLTIQESKIVYLLIEEIKQLKKEIAELKGE